MQPIINPVYIYLAELCSSIKYTSVVLLFIIIGIIIASCSCWGEIETKVEEIEKEIKEWDESKNTSLKEEAAGRLGCCITSDHCTEIINKKEEKIVVLTTEIESWKRDAKIEVLAAVLFALAFMFTPSTDTCYKMIAASVVTTDNINSVRSGIKTDVHDVVQSIVFPIAEAIKGVKDTDSDKVKVINKTSEEVAKE